MKKKVIEFDLPKGYSAEDAYQSAVIEFSHLQITDRWIAYHPIREHFKYEMWHLEKDEKTNLYLLLAVANGHELE